MSGLVVFLQNLFVDKAPALPEGFKSFIVKVGPYVVVVALIFIGLTLLSAIPFLFVTGGIFTAFGGGGMLFGLRMMLFTVLGVVNLVLLLMAVPGLFKKTMTGWTYLFYASLLNIATNILTVSLVSVILSIVGLYILFQIRSCYNGISAATPTSYTPPQQPPQSF